MNAENEGPSSGKVVTGTLGSVLLLCGNQKVSILDGTFDVSPRGMSFKTDCYFAPFTDLQVGLLLPPNIGSGTTRIIQCDGVVVECRGSHQRKIYFVTVAFLNLSAPDQKELSIAHEILPIFHGQTKPATNFPKTLTG